MTGQIANQINEHVLVLEAERDRLQNAVVHLVSSNRQLQDALAEGGPDPDFQQAIGENVVVIAKFHAQIAQLNKDIQAIRQSLLEGGPPADCLIAGLAANSAQASAQHPSRHSSSGTQPAADASPAQPGMPAASSSRPYQPGVFQQPAMTSAAVQATSQIPGVGTGHTGVQAVQGDTRLPHGLTLTRQAVDSASGTSSSRMAVHATSNGHAGSTVRPHGLALTRQAAGVAAPAAQQAPGATPAAEGQQATEPMVCEDQPHGQQSSDLQQAQRSAAVTQEARSEDAGLWM